MCCLDWFLVWHRIKTNLIFCLPRIAQIGNEVVTMVDFPDPRNATTKKFLLFHLLSAQKFLFEIRRLDK
jgi:hypothetical protein